MNVLTTWQRMRRWPAGAWVFSRLIGWRVPYAASLGVRVLRAQPGEAQIALPFRRRVRNHFGTVHAAALAHLGEMTANMALMTRQPVEGRWTVTALNTRFLHPARGPITATCTLPELSFAQDANVSGACQLRDPKGELVAELDVTWRIGPKRRREPKAHGSVQPAPAVAS